MTMSRHYSLFDRALIRLEHALATSLATGAHAERPNPGLPVPDLQLDDEARRHAAGLMRINHTGEVCAQALYVGQAAVARDARTRADLLQAAQEETDHLAWCAARLAELDSRPSLLNPFWYAGSYAIGVAAGLAGDGWNLGFVVETERQVEAHLGEHLAALPPGDERSRAILRTMKDDEARHADQALQAGARMLPPPVPRLMALTSAIMKAVAYRV